MPKDKHETAKTVINSRLCGRAFPRGRTEKSSGRWATAVNDLMNVKGGEDLAIIAEWLGMRMSAECGQATDLSPVKSIIWSGNDDNFF